MTGYSAEAQGVIAAVIAGDVCEECHAPNHLRHFDECSQHPENLTGAPAARVVDALSGEVAAAGAEHPVLAANARAQERLQAERDELFRERDAYQQLLYMSVRKTAEAGRQRDDAENEAELLTAALDRERAENGSLRCRLDELVAEVRELRAGQAVSS